MDLYLYEFEANSRLPEERLSLPMLEVKTCQRSFLLSWDELPFSGFRRFFKGASAYEFLLRFAAGLESEIKGETDVFGQLKIAIKQFIDQNPCAEHESLFSRLFEDTKEIRAQYLQGIGGNTYGALARRLVSTTPETRVLILGAGQISKSIAPYFAESCLTVFNRSEDRLSDLKVNLEKKGYPNIHFLTNEASLSTALNQADLILMGTPADSPFDQKVIDCLLAKPESSRPTVLHLGGQQKELSSFSSQGLPILSLTDLFEIEKEQSSFRERQIEQALDACKKRALLRSLARSIHIPHGWEDLALFY